MEMEADEDGGGSNPYGADDGYRETVGMEERDRPGSMSMSEVNEAGRQINDLFSTFRREKSLKDRKYERIGNL